MTDQWPSDRVSGYFGQCSKCGVTLITRAIPGQMQLNAGANDPYIYADQNWWVCPRDPKSPDDDTRSYNFHQPELMVQWAQEVITHAST